MAALQGFITTFQLAALAMAVAAMLGIAPPVHLGRSAAQPAPPPPMEAGDTTALL